MFVCCVIPKWSYKKLNQYILEFRIYTDLFIILEEVPNKRK